MKEFECPFCKGTFRFFDESINSIKDIEGCTCDCPDCGKILLASDGIFVDAIAKFKEEMGVESNNIGYIEI